MSTTKVRAHAIDRRKRDRAPGIQSPEFKRMVDRGYRDVFERRNLPMPDGTLHYGAVERAERKAKQEGRAS